MHNAFFKFRSTKRGVLLLFFLALLCPWFVHNFMTLLDLSQIANYTTNYLFFCVNQHRMMTPTNPSNETHFGLGFGPSELIHVNQHMIAITL